MGGERMRADLEVALELAQRADAITLDRFGALDLRIDTKPDLTPVTDADGTTSTSSPRMCRRTSSRASSSTVSRACSTSGGSGAVIRVGVAVG